MKRTAELPEYSALMCNLSREAKSVGVPVLLKIGALPYTSSTETNFEKAIQRLKDWFKSEKQITKLLHEWLGMGTSAWFKQALKNPSLLYFVELVTDTQAAKDARPWNTEALFLVWAAGCCSWHWECELCSERICSLLANPPLHFQVSENNPSFVPHWKQCKKLVPSGKLAKICWFSYGYQYACVLWPGFSMWKLRWS